MKYWPIYHPETKRCLISNNGKTGVVLSKDCKNSKWELKNDGIIQDYKGQKINYENVNDNYDNIKLNKNKGIKLNLV
jgi:hypothetical protein